MGDERAGTGSTAVACPPDAAWLTSVVQQVVGALPVGCSWLRPVTGPDGTVTDFEVAAATGESHDLYRLGARRVGGRVGDLYPSVVGGTLWQTYHRVVATGRPERVNDFVYTENTTGVAAESRYVVTVHPVLGGLLVYWERLDEQQRRQAGTERLGRLGWSEYDLITGGSSWSPGVYRIFDRDSGLGPMTRSEQNAAMLAADRDLAEAAWQTLDSGAPSDVTVRFRIGESVKHLRILSDVARDGDGHPVKIYAVIQDVTGRVGSRDAITRLREALHTREMTALAEHRLAAQLHRLIQPVPVGPFELAGLEAMAGYLPAESALQVGGDWFHARTQPDGRVALAIGDVAGHGREAAGGMAHLRFALVAWLSIGIDDPGELLAHMNRLCLQLDLTATAIVALYDPAARTMTWARAGHTAPLLGHAGRCAELDVPGGVLLGAEAGGAYPVLVSDLDRGDLVVLYTDGLVERRDHGSDHRLDTVRAGVAAASGAPDALERLRPVLHTASPDDDTCTLAVRVR
jgi:serine phosphatase RsbU (regulator of sigma subunit)